MNKVNYYYYHFDCGDCYCFNANRSNSLVKLADTENIESVSVREAKNDGAEVTLNNEQIADLVSILSNTKKQISLNVLNKDGWEYELTITYTDGTSCKFLDSGSYYSYDKDGKEVSSSRFWLYKSNYNKLVTYLKTIKF